MFTAVGRIFAENRIERGQPSLFPSLSHGSVPLNSLLDGHVDVTIKSIPDHRWPHRYLMAPALHKKPGDSRGIPSRVRPGNFVNYTESGNFSARNIELKRAGGAHQARRVFPDAFKADAPIVRRRIRCIGIH